MTLASPSASGNSALAPSAAKLVSPPSLPPLQTGEIRYPFVGLDMFPAPPNAVAVVTKADTIASFGPLPQVAAHYAAVVGSAAAAPDVVLVNVTDSLPLDRPTETTASQPEQYLAWMITYQGTAPDFRGGVYNGSPPNPTDFSCELVGIRNATTGAWTKVFQSCNPAS